MMMAQRRGNIGGLIYFAIAFTLGLYFTFAAVQGDFGVFRRVEIKAEAEVLRGEKERLMRELTEMQNRSRRLSDAYLDMDLLDERAREVLGYLRFDEIVIR